MHGLLDRRTEGDEAVDARGNSQNRHDYTEEELAALELWGRKIGLAVLRGNKSAAHELVHVALARLREQNKSPLLTTSLIEMGVDVRTANALERERDILTVEDLLQSTPGVLATIPNMGPLNIIGIYSVLLRYTITRVIELEAK